MEKKVTLMGIIRKVSKIRKIGEGRNMSNALLRKCRGRGGGIKSTLWQTIAVYFVRCKTCKACACISFQLWITYYIPVHAFLYVVKFLTV